LIDEEKSFISPTPERLGGIEDNAGEEEGNAGAADREGVHVVTDGGGNNAKTGTHSSRQWVISGKKISSFCFVNLRYDSLATNRWIISRMPPEQVTENFRKVQQLTERILRHKSEVS